MDFKSLDLESLRNWNKEYEQRFESCYSETSRHLIALDKSPLSTWSVSPAQRRARKQLILNLFNEITTVLGPKGFSRVAETCTILWLEISLTDREKIVLHALKDVTVRLYAAPTDTIDETQGRGRALCPETVRPTFSTTWVIRCCCSSGISGDTRTRPSSPSTRIPSSVTSKSTECTACKIARLYHSRCATWRTTSSTTASTSSPRLR